jgi:hypothetical protein
MKVIAINGIIFVKRWGKLYYLVDTDNGTVMVRVKELKR